MFPNFDRYKNIMEVQAEIANLEINLAERKNAVKAIQERIVALEHQINEQYTYLQSHNKFRQVAVEVESLLTQLKELQKNAQQNEQAVELFEQQRPATEQYLKSLETDIQTMQVQMRQIQDQQRKLHLGTHATLEDISNSTRAAESNKHKDAELYEARLAEVSRQIVDAKQQISSLQQTIANQSTSQTQTLLTKYQRIAAMFI